MRNDRFVIESLELHLFFGRIMKEHALFLRAGFTPANAAFLMYDPILRLLPLPARVLFRVQRAFRSEAYRGLSISQSP